MMRLNSRRKESIQNLLVFKVFSVPSRNNTAITWSRLAPQVTISMAVYSNYMVEIGPGGVTISMAVIGAGTVAAAPATNRSKCMGLLVFRRGGGGVCVCVRVSVCV